MEGQAVSAMVNAACSKHNFILNLILLIYLCKVTVQVRCVHVQYSYKVSISDKLHLVRVSCASMSDRTASYA